MKNYLVITTINPKSFAISQFEKMDDWHLIIVGDKKSQPIKESSNLTYLSVEDQLQLNYEFVGNCPYNHYARKNIGYLYAFQNGAELIYDTDDDNIPYDSWTFNEFSCTSTCSSNQKFVNIYKFFSDENIWPRGYPLDEIHKTTRHEIGIKKTDAVEIGVWQALADKEPDVDAIFRLVHQKQVTFQKNPPLYLDKQVYCPFNSQNTAWNAKAFPYLYLPVSTSFRFTDILRGYIAQKLMWEDNLHLGFTEATVYQERNVHDLMKDFKDEWECYLNVKPIVEILDSLSLTSDNFNNLHLIYTTLANENLINSVEIDHLEGWINDFKQLTQVS